MASVVSFCRYSRWRWRQGGRNLTCVRNEQASEKRAVWGVDRAGFELGKVGSRIECSTTELGPKPLRIKYVHTLKKVPIMMPLSRNSWTTYLLDQGSNLVKPTSNDLILPGGISMKNIDIQEAIWQNSSRDVACMKKVCTLFTYKVDIFLLFSSVISKAKLCLRIFGSLKKSCHRRRGFHLKRQDEIKVQLF